MLLSFIASQSNLLYIFQVYESSNILKDFMKKKYQELAQTAQQARFLAHAPFSQFRVGAALLARNGQIYTGCNIENSSFGLTMCAERVAVFKAVSTGESKFSAIAIVSDDTGFTSPCGACRQVLIDLAGDIDCVMMNSKNQFRISKLSALLPFAFTEKTLKHVHKRIQ
jgi:cytidine deaminase